MSANVLVADPPWAFGDSLPGKGRGAAAHYTCMTVADICAMQIPDVGPDAVLFLWRVAAMPQEALDVVRAWGFTPKSELVWEKLTSAGKPHFGMGHYVRASHETCLIAARGRAFPAVRNVRSRFAAPVGVHSQKPDEFYRLVEAMYPDAVRYELFARTVRAGWVQSGNELGKLGAA